MPPRPNAFAFLLFLAFSFPRAHHVGVAFRVVFPEYFVEYMKNTKKGTALVACESFGYTIGHFLGPNGAAEQHRRRLPSKEEVRKYLEEN
jgi:hypothetical protein